MKRLLVAGWTLFLLALGAGAAEAQLRAVSVPVARPPVAEARVFAGRYARIECEAPLPFARLKSLADRADRAFSELLSINGWSHAARQRIASRPFVVSVLSDRAMLSKHPDIPGLTTDADHFVISLRYFETAAADATLGHELTHLQDWRVVGGPFRVFVSEARARASAAAYLAQARLPSPDQARHDAAYALAKLTAAEARIGGSLSRGGEVQMDEAVRGYLAFFFVEYLRVHKGIPDVAARMAQIAEERRNEPAAFEEGWRRHFGTTFEAHVSDMLAFLRATEGNADARFKGTYWEDRPARP